LVYQTTRNRRFRLIFNKNRTVVVRLPKIRTMRALTMSTTNRVVLRPKRALKLTVPVPVLLEEAKWRSKQTLKKKTSSATQR
ncbi:hypothetical protein SK128_015107, partial [Halocaridina rubra]